MSVRKFARWFLAWIWSTCLLCAGTRHLLDKVTRSHIEIVEPVDHSCNPWAIPWPCMACAVEQFNYILSNYPEDNCGGNAQFPSPCAKPFPAPDMWSLISSHSGITRAAGQGATTVLCRGLMMLVTHLQLSNRNGTRSKVTTFSALSRVFRPSVDRM